MIHVLLMSLVAREFGRAKGSSRWSVALIPIVPSAKRIRYRHEEARRGEMSIDDERGKYATTPKCHEVRQGAMEMA